LITGKRKGSVVFQFPYKKTISLCRDNDVGGRSAILNCVGKKAKRDGSVCLIPFRGEAEAISQ